MFPTPPPGFKRLAEFGPQKIPEWKSEASSFGPQKITEYRSEARSLGSQKIAERKNEASSFVPGRVLTQEPDIVKSAVDEAFESTVFEILSPVATKPELQISQSRTAPQSARPSWKRPRTLAERTQVTPDLEEIGKEKPKLQPGPAPDFAQAPASAGSEQHPAAETPPTFSFFAQALGRAPNRGTLGSTPRKLGARGSR